MNIALWIVQVLLAAAFLMSGMMKIGNPPEELIKAGMTFVSYTPHALVKFIGAAELFGALGLLLPSLTRIQPKLTPIAAALLGVVMLLAAITHLTHGEAPMIVPNIILGALASFTAWGRWSKAPITPR